MQTLSNLDAHTINELVERLRRGDQEAFTRLYNAYSSSLYTNILSLVKDHGIAGELLQDIFVRIWQRRESIYAEQRFDGYLFRISYNRVIDYFRQVSREKKLYSRLQQAAGRNYYHVEEALLKRENEGILEKAIGSLSPQQQTAFRLCKLEGLSYQQVSERMGISLSTVKNHMAMARHALRQFVQANRETALLAIILLSIQL